MISGIFGTCDRAMAAVVNSSHKFRTFFLGLLGILLFVGTASWFTQFLPDRSDINRFKEDHFSLDDLSYPTEEQLTSAAISGQRSDCHYYNCFDVYRCGQRDTSVISVYIYPPRKYIDGEGIPVTPPVSKEFHAILKTIARSRFYTTDPEEACILVPSLDLLNQNRLRLDDTGKVLASLHYWNKGHNHLLFNMLPGGVPEYSTVLEVASGAAMIAGAGYSTRTYRHGFDISIPMYNPLMQNVSVLPRTDDMYGTRHWVVVSSQLNIHDEYREELNQMAEEFQDILVLDKCGSQDETVNYFERCAGQETYKYPEILRESDFCLILRGARLGQPSLMEAMMMGCIPVVVADRYVLPFSDVIDWKKAAVELYEEQLPSLIHVLRSITEERIISMSHQVEWLYSRYFSSVERITDTVLEILNDRVFPHAARSYSDWNIMPHGVLRQSPLFLPITAQKSQGFTAVILTYDRLESLFQVIQRVVRAPSLAKVLVVWNNQKKPPPHPSIWPKINKPLKVVQTRRNKLSNRFYPYEEIETEAILAIDDDIVMLTADELEFGYEVWREFPDRIVGFPSRTHVWDNVTSRWKYESEWTNEISMVLTGAAFYHKYWNYLYTTAMPGDIKTWVDDHMNCEDIAMNFLVANITGKAPIKVTPRKKFKCPECAQNEMLSADLSHMVERSECINQFTQVYGGVMPLRSVEFRADPVLYKDNFPEKLKRFHDVGYL